MVLSSLFSVGWQLLSLIGFQKQRLVITPYFAPSRHSTCTQYCWAAKLRETLVRDRRTYFRIFVPGMPFRWTAWSAGAS